MVRRGRAPGQGHRWLHRTRVPFDNGPVPRVAQSVRRRRVAGCARRWHVPCPVRASVHGPHSWLAVGHVRAVAQETTWQTRNATGADTVRVSGRTGWMSRRTRWTVTRGPLPCGIWTTTSCRAPWEGPRMRARPRMMPRSPPRSESGSQTIERDGRAPDPPEVPSDAPVSAVAVAARQRTVAVGTEHEGAFVRRRRQCRRALLHEARQP